MVAEELSSFARRSPAGLFLEIDIGASDWPARSFTMKQASVSSTVHGGGKRRLEITRRLNRRFVIILKLLLNKINAASRLCAF